MMGKVYPFRPASNLEQDILGLLHQLEQINPLPMIQTVTVDEATCAKLEALQESVCLRHGCMRGEQCSRCYMEELILKIEALP